MAKKIIGVTVGTTSPRPNWTQTNIKKSDYIKNKPEQDLPNVTTADNNKVLQVEGGKWQAKTIADANTVVSQHNTSEKAHNDIRVLLKALSDNVTDLLDSDDETLNEMHEIVAYIKANKDLIDGITTTKVNVDDIIDNLTTSLSNRPLSAKQGVELANRISSLNGYVENQETDIHSLSNTLQEQIDKHNNLDLQVWQNDEDIEELIDKVATMEETIAGQESEYKKYTDDKVAELVESAPAELDTLRELAEALSENESLSATIITEIGKKANATDVANDLAGKLNKTDIVNNLTTTNATKVLSAAQGKALADRVTALEERPSGGGGSISEDVLETFEFITEADVDEICGATFVDATENEVAF